jgi:hypothetical protein
MKEQTQILLGLLSLLSVHAVAQQQEAADKAPTARPLWPETEKELSGYLEKVRAVSVARLSVADAQVPFLRGARHETATGYTQAPDSSVPVAEARSVAVKFGDAAEVADWVAAIKASPRGRNPASMAGSLFLILDLEGGRPLHVRVWLGEPAFLLCGKVGLDAGARAMELLEQAARKADLALRRHVGVALDLDELRALPATRRTVRCPVLPAEILRSELARFEDLRRLALQDDGQAAPVEAETVAQLAQLRTLRHLELPADGLGADELRALATLPLHSLVLTGDVPAIPAKVFAGFEKLEALGLCAAGCDLDLHAALACLPSLKTLRLDDCSWLRPQDYGRLLATKLERLDVSQATTIEGIEQLAQLPSLRTLRLASIVLGPEQFEALGQLQRLERLELMGVLWTTPLRHQPMYGLLGLRKLLPDCDVVHVAFRLGVDGTVQRR